MAGPWACRVGGSGGLLAGGTATDQATVSLASDEPALSTLCAQLPFCGVRRAGGAAWSFSGLLPAHCVQAKWTGSRPTPKQAKSQCPVVACGDLPCCNSGKSAMWSCHWIAHHVVCTLWTATELSSYHRSVTTVTQSTTTHSPGAEWNLLSYRAGLGLVTV